MKAPKYIYYVVDALGDSTTVFPPISREEARIEKRFAEDNLDEMFEKPFKIVRFAVNPTGEVIR